MKLNEQQQAIIYRQEGKSINDIARILHVSIGSVSPWVKHIILTDEQKVRLRNNTMEKAIPAHKTKEFRKKCEDRWNEWRRINNRIKSVRVYSAKKIQYQRLQRHRLKLKMVNFKGGKCELCGYSENLAVLGFHHRDSKKKEFQLSRCVRKWEHILPELEKCTLLCINCHTALHHPNHNVEEKQ